MLIDVGTSLAHVARGDLLLSGHVAKRKFALERGGRARLEVSWRGDWAGLEVRLDGRLLATFPKGRALKSGKAVEVGDGSVLELRLAKTFYGEELQVSRDGVPLPGSPHDPETRLKDAWEVFYVLAGLNAGIGLVAVVSGSELLAQYGLGWDSVLGGAIFFGLGTWVRLSRSKVVLAVATALYVVDWVYSMYTTLPLSRTPPIAGFIFRLVLAAQLWRGFGAIRDLERQALEAQKPKSGLPPPSTENPWESPRS